MEKHVSDIIEWLQSQVKKANVKGLLVGVSGGLDSAVVAYLIKRAFPDDSLGVIMPLKSSETDMKDALSVVEKSGLEQMTIDLTETHQSLFSEIQNQLTTSAQDNNPLTDANLRARLRMSTLYAIASHRHYMVVGTDNASEWYTGYFTKYGDGGVDILPLIEYTKHEVRQMAKCLGVPQEVIDKKPSADLWVGQTDEDEMGTSYDHIDAYLQGEQIPKEDRKVIEQMHERTAHKRNVATPFIFR